jgi:hypothetical protein
VEARQEGAVDGTEPAQDVAEHLQGCAQCQADAETMAELLATLGQLEQPPIPADVALRIDAALAEAARTPVALAAPAAATDAAVTRTADASTSGSEPGMPGSEAGFAAQSTDEDLAGSRRQSSEGPPGLLAERRPPTLGPTKRHPDSRRPHARRSLRRTLSWTLASLVVLGGAAGLATLALSSSGNSTSGPSASAARGVAPPLSGSSQALRNDGAQSSNAEALAALTSWTKSALATSSSSEPADLSPSAHPHALTTAPTSAVAAAEIEQCLANPATKGRQVLGTSYGVFLGKSAVLVVYAIGDGSQSVDSVAYQAPCASTGYLVLAEGTVPK